MSTLPLEVHEVLEEEYVSMYGVAPADYDQYCINAPKDSRLPSGGGQQICGLYDVTPTKFGLSNNVVTKASNFGKQRRVNDFFNVTFTGRISKTSTLWPLCASWKAHSLPARPAPMIFTFMVGS